MFADSSSERATCSTIWLGDHLPEPRDEVQAVPVRSPALINCSIASLLASSVWSIFSIRFSGILMTRERSSIGHPRVLLATKEEFSDGDDRQAGTNSTLAVSERKAQIRRGIQHQDD